MGAIIGHTEDQKESYKVIRISEFSLIAGY